MTSVTDSQVDRHRCGAGRPHPPGPDQPHPVGAIAPAELVLGAKQVLHEERYMADLAPDWQLSRDVALLANIRLVADRPKEPPHHA